MNAALTKRILVYTASMGLAARAWVADVKAEYKKRRRFLLSFFN